MNKVLAVIFIILALGAGFIGGKAFKSDKAEGLDPNLKLAGSLIGNPVVSNIILEGKVAAVGKDTVTLEREGMQVIVYFAPGSVFSKVDKPEEILATPSSTTAVTELPVGSEVVGRGLLQKDPGSGEYKIYTTNFWVR